MKCAPLTSHTDRPGASTIGCHKLMINMQLIMADEGLPDHMLPLLLYTLELSLEAITTVIQAYILCRNESAYIYVATGTVTKIVCVR